MRRSADEARKADTRRKIEWGGLVVKAGLSGEDAALVLGILLDGKKRTSDHPAERERFIKIGKDAFK